MNITISKEYENLAPRLSDFDYQKLYNSIKQRGLLEPVKINQNGILLDGHNRYSICLELQKPIKTVEYTFEDSLEELRFVKDCNLERRNLNTFQRCQLGYNFKRYYEEKAKERFGGHHKTNSVGIPTELNEEEGRTRDKIADDIGVNPQTYWYAQKIIETKYDEDYTKKKLEDIAKNLSEQDKQKETYQQYIGDVTETIQNYQSKLNELNQALINEKKGIESAYNEIKGYETLIQQEIEKLKPKTDIEILEDLEISILPYDVWNIQKLNPLYGRPYPGNIPAEIVFNTLYFFTEQDDLIIDPMAGGGVVGDVCKPMRRKCLMYDVKPMEEREDIIKHDILSGIPKESEDAELLFWDPPYYKKKQMQYGEESISILSRKSFLEVFSEVAHAAYNAGIKKIALLVSDYDDEYNDDSGSNNIFIWDYVKTITSTKKWRVHRHIHCPLTTQQITGQRMQLYKEQKKLHRLSRSLVIFFRR